MAYVKKTFSFPAVMWGKFEEYTDAHPECTKSGLLQKLMTEFISTQEQMADVQSNSQS